VAQVGTYGYYPGGRYRGGYRNPFGYPYYRYKPRHYPFAVGPYGPYGSNYGGYSGNGYDPNVYGSTVPGGLLGKLPEPDADLPPTPDGNVPSPQATPQDVAEPPPAPVRPPASVRAVPTPQNGPPIVGPPVPAGPDPFNPTYGAAGNMLMWPPGSWANNMWQRNTGLIYGFGAYPALSFPYVYGPPSGYGYYTPTYAPQYDLSPRRNFGPSYPAAGRMFGGAPYVEGW
jgi:hypothetical protein